MRVGIVLAVCLVSSAAHADPVDVADLPARPRALATKLVAAFDDDRAKAFLALVPSSVQLDGKSMTRAALKRAIHDAGSLREYLGALFRGDARSGNQFDAEVRDDGTVEVSSAYVTFVIAAHRRRWGLTSIERAGARDATAILTSPLTITGDGLSEATIHRYVGTNAGRIRYCLDKKLLADPDAKGSVVVELVIAADGTVIASTATGFDAELADCVASAVKTIQFPKPTGGGAVKVSYPIDFEPEETDDNAASSLPAAAQPLATKLKAALDGDDAKAFLALLPPKLQVDSQTTRKAQVAKAIRDAGSLAAYLTSHATETTGWRASVRDDGTIELVDHGITFLLVEHKRKWSLASIEHNATPTHPVSLTAVLDGALEVVGGLDADAIRAQVRAHADALTACYQKAKDQTVGGQIDVTFEIAADGSVETGHASGWSTDVADCVAGIFHQMTFPKPKDGASVKVTYPLSFRPAG